MFSIVRMCLIPVALGLTYGSTLSAAESQSCYVDILAYDAYGHRLPPVKIVSVKTTSKEDMLALRTPIGRFVVASSPTSRLYFPRQAPLPSADLVFGFVDASGKRHAEGITLLSCRSQVAVSLGQQETGADVSGSVIRGKLTGCSFSDEWWIRAFPMYGGQLTTTFTGSIIDGNFEIIGGMKGVRSVIVIGFRKEPVKTFATNLLAGGSPNDLGTIDLSLYCKR